MKDNKSSLEIVTLKREELPKLAELFCLVWGGDYNQVYSKTKWAFDDEKSIVLIAKDKNTGEIVGARGAIYWPLQCKDQILETYQFHGTCVHPDYRRMGIFSSLNKSFLELAKELNIYGIFNVSVEASMKGYQKLGWSYLPGFERLIKLPNPLQIATRTVKASFKKVEIQNNNQVKSDDFNIDDNVLENLLGKRNNAYMRSSLPFSFYDKQRFIKRLSEDYAGYKYMLEEDSLAIYKITTIKQSYKGLLIGDILLNNSDPALFKKIIKKLIEREKPDFVLTYISSEHPNYKHFKKSGFFSTFKKDMNFGSRIIDPKNKDLFGETVWQTSIFDIDTF
ncbi:GNAT family N-acetyltransferase [Sutcliffiella horikoshii]|uniref:GNAT family N-acetyltransferase n=1 Tax=Sutcliffiella horikoshii TaxID=79883 RepID=UPI003CF586AD